MENIQLINFTQCSRDELTMILRWRNSQQVKEWMLNSSEITLSSHLSFINSLKEVSNKLYFLVRDKDAYIGVVDFTDISSNSCIMGLYKNPDLYGIGDSLITIICEYAFKTLFLDTIHAEVFMDNHKAVKLYKRHNFVEVKKEIFQEKELLHMECKNEDR